MPKWKFRCTKHSEDVREYRLICKDSFFNQKMLFTAFLLITHLLTWPFWSTTKFILVTLVVCIFFGMLFLDRVMKVKEESLMVIRELGVQISTISFIGIRRTQFIEKKKIHAVIINEGIQSFQVLYYMAFILHEQKKMLIAFEHVFPRMPVLLSIFRGTRSLLYGEPEDDEIEESDDVYKGATQEDYMYCSTSEKLSNAS